MSALILGRVNLPDRSSAPQTERMNEGKGIHQLIMEADGKSCNGHFSIGRVNSGFAGHRWTLPVDFARLTARDAKSWRLPHLVVVKQAGPTVWQDRQDNLRTH